MTIRPRLMAQSFRRVADAFRHRSLLTNFGLISLIAITVIGLVLGNMLRASVERQVLDGAIAEAEVVSQLGLRDIIGPRELANGLSPTRLDAVRFGLRADLAEIGVVDMVLWNLDNDVVFATDDEMIGRASPTNSEIMRAAGGRPAVRITDVSAARADLQEHGSVVEVFQPVRFGTVGTAEVVGVLMTAIPYGPVAAAIDLEVSRLRVVLFTVFLLLYAVLFRLVANASVELRARADQNEWQARHDGLTGLPNRVLFSEEIATELDVTPSGPIAVVMLDLDRFKEVNDTLGHHHGDLLLMEVGQRLEATLRPSDRVARFGGDEFALMLADVKDTATALVVANRIVEAIAEPFEVGGLRLDVGASLGLAMSPEHGTDLATLLQKADIAMYQAKREGSDCVLYDPDNDHHSREQLALAGELRRGMENELVVHFQPKVELEDERVCGVEALVRWNHPEHGLLPPGEFMAMAERSGLMNGLTRVVLAEDPGTASRVARCRARRRRRRQRVGRWVCTTAAWPTTSTASWPSMAYRLSGWCSRSPRPRSRRTQSGQERSCSRWSTVGSGCPSMTSGRATPPWRCCGRCPSPS